MLKAAPLFFFFFLFIGSALHAQQTTPCDSTVIVPNMFTPNGDGYYDAFIPTFTHEQPAEFEMKIYDRWGRLVYETTDLRKGWEGNTDPEGTYFWVITYRYSSKGIERFSCNGSITLLK